MKKILFIAQTFGTVCAMAFFVSSRAASPLLPSMPSVSSEVPPLMDDPETLLTAAIILTERSETARDRDRFLIELHKFACKNGLPSQSVADALRVSLERRYAQAYEYYEQGGTSFGTAQEPFWIDLCYAADFLEIGDTNCGGELLERGLADLRKQAKLKECCTDLFPRISAAGKQKEAKEALKLMAQRYRPNTKNVTVSGFEGNLYSFFEEQLTIREFDDALETARIIVKMNLPWEKMFSTFSRFSSHRAGKVDAYGRYFEELYGPQPPLPPLERFLLRIIDTQSRLRLFDKALATLNKLTDHRSQGIAWTILADDYAKADLWKETHDALDRGRLGSLQRNMILYAIIPAANDREKYEEVDSLLMKYFKPEDYAPSGLNSEVRKWALIRMAHGNIDAGMKLLETVAQDDKQRSAVLMQGLGSYLWSNDRRPPDGATLWANSLKVRALIPEEHFAERITFDLNLLRMFYKNAPMRTSSGGFTEFDENILLVGILERLERLGKKPDEYPHSLIEGMFEVLIIFIDKKEYDAASRIVTLLDLEKFVEADRFVEQARTPNDDFYMGQRLLSPVTPLARLFYATKEMERYDKVMAIAQDWVTRYLQSKDEAYGREAHDYYPGPPPERHYLTLAEVPKRIELQCLLDVGEYDAAFEIFEAMQYKQDAIDLVEQDLIAAQVYDKLREFCMLVGKYPDKTDSVERYQRRRISPVIRRLVEEGRDAAAEELASAFADTLEAMPEVLHGAKLDRSVKKADVGEVIRLLNAMPDGIGKAYWILQLLQKMPI